MNAQDAQLLTLEPKMVCQYIVPDYEYYEGDILYCFYRAADLDLTIDVIMRDSSTLCLWIDPNGNGIVSSKTEFLK